MGYDTHINRLVLNKQAESDQKVFRRLFECLDMITDMLKKQTKDEEVKH